MRFFLAASLVAVAYGLYGDNVADYTFPYEAGNGCPYDVPSNGVIIDTRRPSEWSEPPENTDTHNDADGTNVAAADDSTRVNSPSGYDRVLYASWAYEGRYDENGKKEVQPEANPENADYVENLVAQAESKDFNLDKETTIFYTYCKTGGRAGDVCDELAKSGYKHCLNLGGWNSSSGRDEGNVLGGTTDEGGIGLSQIAEADGGPSCGVPVKCAYDVSETNSLLIDLRGDSDDNERPTHTIVVDYAEDSEEADFLAALEEAFNKEFKDDKRFDVEFAAVGAENLDIVVFDDVKADANNAADALEDLGVFNSVKSAGSINEWPRDLECGTGDEDAIAFEAAEIVDEDTESPAALASSLVALAAIFFAL